MNSYEIQLVDEHAWDRFDRALSAFLPTAKQVKNALASTNVRMSRMFRIKALRELPAILHIPRKILRPRIKNFKIFSDVRGGKVWLGLDGISFSNLRPEEYAQGTITKDGKFYEQGAFIVPSKKKPGRLLVFKRQGKTWVAPGKRGALDWVRADIDEKVLKWLENGLKSPDFSQKYFARLEHELRWRTTS